MDLAQAVTADVIKQLRDARTNKGYSLEALAEAADLHRTSVGLIERGRRGSMSSSPVVLSSGTGTG